MGEYILSLDQGTTSSRTILFDLEGNPVATAQQEFTQHYPKPGWVEHNAEEIWESQLATVKQCLARAGVSPEKIVAIGVTNQRETTVIWNKKNGKPVGHAIVWQDRRTVDICEGLKQRGLAETFRKRTGLVLDPYFSGTKIKWMLDNEPSLRPLAEKGELACGTIDSWLIYKLTGGAVHATDVSNASRTLLFNIHKLAWDDELLEILTVPRSLLPEVKASAADFGTTDRGLFGAAIPIRGVAGDQQAALFGQVCLQPGMAKNTYGTGAFLVMNTGPKPVDAKEVIATVAWQIGSNPAQYALEGSIFIAGAAVQWLRDGLNLIKTSAEVEDLAKSVTTTDGVYFVPALVGLGAPHWDPYARGTIVGITRGTTKAHLARAALEAMAYQSRDVIEAMERVSGIKLKELRVDGGAAVNNLMMQFQADLLGVPVVRPKVTETTALGAALLAAIGAGVKSETDISRLWRLDQVFRPQMDRAESDRLYRGWQRALDRAKGWLE